MTMMNTYRTLHKMPFGMYRGTYLCELPADYLEWLQTIELREPVRSWVLAEVARQAENRCPCCDRVMPPLRPSPLWTDRL